MDNIHESMDFIHGKNLFNPRTAQHIRINHQSAVADAKQNLNQLMVIFSNLDLIIRLLHNKTPNRTANIARTARQ